MAITIYKDTLDTQEVTVDKNGYKAVRKIILSGVTATNTDGIVYAGLTYSGLASIGVRVGLAHPTMTALFCESLRGRALDVDKVEITACYAPFASDKNPNNTQQPKLTVSSFIQTSDTNEDKTGALLKVTHTGDADIVSTVQVDTCLPNLSFSRLETAPPINLQTYVDTLNDASITWRGVNFATKTLKITSINGTPQDDSGNYQVTYNILYNPTGWKATCVYVKDGVVPADVVASNGIETYEIYPTSTFSTLNLS
jgi:hypothetical protein